MATAWVSGPFWRMYRRVCARCRRRPSPGCRTSATLLPAFEMFDLRYHLASLAAVFIALAVGILLGVAISGKLSAADNRFAHDRIDQLSEQLQQANARADIVGRRNQAAEDLLEISYP